MCKELVPIGGKEHDTERCKNERQRETYIHSCLALDSCFQSLTAEATLTSGFLIPGFSALILQVAPIAFQ